MEVLCQINLAYYLGYIDACAYNEKQDQVSSVSRVLLGLHHSIKKKINQQPQYPHKPINLNPKDSISSLPYKSLRHDLDPSRV